MLVSVAVAAPSPAQGQPVISGSGKFKYQWDPTKMVLPPSVSLLHGHGVTKDKASPS